jgi:glycosyltransferase involved in cell wall biosynthesis
MKVVINTIVTPADNKIGVGVYIDNLVRHLSQQFPTQDFLTFVNNDKPAVDYQSHNCHNITFRARPQPSVLLGLWQPAFAYYLKKTKADIYHLPNTAPFLCKVCPSIGTILDLQEFKTDKYSASRTFYRRLANLLISRLADIIITISKNSKRDIVELLKINPDKIRVIYLAHSEAFRKLDKYQSASYVLNKYGFRDYVLTVGDIQAGKNLVRLIEAFAMLKNSNQECKLVLVGKERSPYSELHETIRRMRLENTVKFTGYVSQEDLIHLYNAAHLCVYPSLYEGFGLPILEAMACGTPVVTSNISSIPEVAGGAALLFDPSDVHEMMEKINMVLARPELREHLSAQGLRRVTDFSWRRTATETMEVYEQVVQMRHKSKRDARL